MQSEIKLGERILDTNTGTLRTANGSAVALRSQSTRVLLALAEANGELVQRDDLVQAVWPDIAVTDDSLIQCIADIRRALQDTKRDIVKTVVGRGYSLAVEPLANATDDAPAVFINGFQPDACDEGSQTICDDLFDALVTRLSTRTGLRIVTETEPKTQAKYAISGKVQSGDDAVKVSFRLSQTEGNTVFFSDAKTSDRSQASTLTTSVADTIAAQLRVHMIVHDGEGMVDKSNADLSTQELKAKAAWHMARFHRENWNAAEAALNEAVNKTPRDATACAMHASMATQMIPLIPFAELRHSADDAMARANTAVEAAQSNDYVLRTRANIRLWMLQDHDGARRDCGRALKLNPAFHLAHFTIAESEIMSGEAETGISRLLAMMERAPQDPQNPLYHSMIALGCLIEKRLQDAHKAAQEAHELWPTQPWCALLFAMSCVANKTAIPSDPALLLALPRTHFRDMPFSRAADLENLEALQADAISAQNI